MSKHSRKPPTLFSTWIMPLLVALGLPLAYATCRFFQMYVSLPHAPTNPLIQEIVEKYHMDEPMFTQALRFLHTLVTFDMGPSMNSTVFTVNEIIFANFSLDALVCALLLIALVIASLYRSNIKLNGLAFEYLPHLSILLAICNSVIIKNPLAGSVLVASQIILTIVSFYICNDHDLAKAIAVLFVSVQTPLAISFLMHKGLGVILENAIHHRDDSLEFGIKYYFVCMGSFNALASYFLNRIPGTRVRPASSACPAPFQGSHHQ